MTTLLKGSQPEQAPTNNGRYLTGYKAQPEQEPVACERCEELGYDKATYYRLYEQACIELQKIKKQSPAAEIEVSYTEIDGERITVLSCELDVGFHKLYTAPPQREWQGLTDEEWQRVMEAEEIKGGIPVKFARAIEAKLKEKNNEPFRYT